MNTSIIPMRRPLSSPPMQLKEAAKSSMNRLMLAEMTCRKAGHRIRVLRIAYRMTREDMAQRVGLTPSQIEELESCKGNTCRNLLKQVASFFKVPVDELALDCQ